MTKILIGSAETDSNGIASVPYTGAGRGKVNILTECRNQSEPYPILDTLVYDKGLEGTGNHNDSAWENTSSTSVFSRGEDGTTVTNNTNNNQTLIANIVSGGSYDFTPPFRVEFNFEKLNTGTQNSQIQIFDSSNNYFSSWITVTGKYVIDVKENEVTWTINGEPQTGKTVTLGNVFVRFLLSASASMKFSEFKIYPI